MPCGRVRVTVWNGGGGDEEVVLAAVIMGAMSTTALAVPMFR